MEKYIFLANIFNFQFCFIKLEERDYPINYNIFLLVSKLVMELSVDFLIVLKNI